MVFVAMHRFMEFQNGGDEFGHCRNPEARWPVLFHLHKEVYKPLAGNIIAQ